MKYKTIVIGTTNPEKLIEFKDGLNLPDLELLQGKGEAPEDHLSFMENAVQKAEWYSEKTNHLVVSDDSGLVVQALEADLDGKGTIDLPGVFSARFCYLDLFYDSEGVLFTRYPKEDPGIEYIHRNETNRTRLLTITNNWKRHFRAAYFNCAMVVAINGKRVWSTEKRIYGRIASISKGSNGFGYDPIFIPESSPEHYNDYNRTLAEYSLEEKQRISHRGKALKALRSWLQD